MLDLKPDVVLQAGDLTTTALQSEFQDVAAALLPLRKQTRMVVVPGNHDRYTFASTRSRALERVLPDETPATFPSLQPLNDAWQLLAIDAAAPRLISSRGRVGKDALKAIDTKLTRLPEGMGVVVLCHYPVVAPPAIHRGWGHVMEGEPALREVLRGRRGPVVFLHGHVHRPWLFQAANVGLDHMVDVCSGAPCMVSRSYPYGQGFWRLELPEDVGAWPEFWRHTPTPRMADEPQPAGAPPFQWRQRRVQ